MRIPFGWFAISVVVMTNIVLLVVYFLSIKYIRIYRNRKDKNRKLLTFLDQKLAIKVISAGIVFLLDFLVLDFTLQEIFPFDACRLLKRDCFIHSFCIYKYDELSGFQTFGIVNERLYHDIVNPLSKLWNEIFIFVKVFA